MKIGLIIDYFVSLRVAREQEIEGLDSVSDDECAYDF